MEIEKFIYEGVVEPSYKNLLGQMPTMLVTEEELEENPTRQKLTSGQVKALASARKCMSIVLIIDFK